MGMISCQVYIHNNMVKLTQLVKIFFKIFMYGFSSAKKSPLNIFSLFHITGGS